jgi:hypothetical protein
MIYPGKFFQLSNDYTLNKKPLSKTEITLLLSLVIVSVVIKIIVIPYNMMTMGDSATRVWNALWWAQEPFFVLPQSGHPLWFYFMGSLIKLTGEFYYTSIVTMILLMTIAGFYVFRITYMISDFRAAIISFLIFQLNPVIFRLNFEPYSQQPYLTSMCALTCFLLPALCGDNSRRNFTIAGILGFIGLGFRPEAVFVLMALCIIAFISGQKGRFTFIILSLLFQVIWIVISIYVYGTLFKTLQSADQYTDPINIQGLSLGLRLRGFFIPYYFLVLGLTVFIFYFFIKGVLIAKKQLPKIIFITLITVMIVPALVNGIAGVKSTIYHTTHYIYLMFYISPVFASLGLSRILTDVKNPYFARALICVIILSCIPLSYIKEFVPHKYNKLFPKVIQFIATTEDPDETRKLLEFIDENIYNYPALIFDADDNSSGIFYIPFRTKLPALPAKDHKIMITGYNAPADRTLFEDEMKLFMKRNPSGIIITKKANTLLNQIMTEISSRPYIRNNIRKASESEKWNIFTYQLQ